MVFESELSSMGMDMLKIMKMCLIHDLGEAIHGDISAIDQNPDHDKSKQEKADLIHLMRSLDATQSADIMQLWQEYEDASTPESKAVKALDKLETILQHNQGINPPDFNYEFNLGYGQKHTSAEPLFALIRNILDEETSNKIKQSK